jgi:CHAT domain-containing protein
MIGLTRAFFYAGASSIMASLWMVSDQSTAILMKDFYSHYIRGERASTALRQAKLNMLKNNDQSYRHPFFWAPFIIMGSF